MNRVQIIVHDDGSVTLHRTDLPAVARSEEFDILLDFEHLERTYLEARRNTLGLDDTTGGL